MTNENVFIISHMRDILFDKFTNIIKFEKEHNFTKLEDKQMLILNILLFLILLFVIVMHYKTTADQNLHKFHIRTKYLRPDKCS